MSKKDTQQAASPKPETPTEDVNVQVAPPPEEATAAVAPQNRMIHPGMLRVRVVRQPVTEGGEHYAKGQEFFLPDNRRRALGGLVEVVPENAES